MTHDEMIAVIQAHKDSKTIEYLNEHNTKLWRRCIGDPIWDFSIYKYRVKPEKKEGWINVYRVRPEVGDASLISGMVIYEREDLARGQVDPDGYIDTIKIEWEE